MCACYIEAASGGETCSLRKSRDDLDEDDYAAAVKELKLRIQLESLRQKQQKQQRKELADAISKLEEQIMML